MDQQIKLAYHFKYTGTFQLFNFQKPKTCLSSVSIYLDAQCHRVLNKLWVVTSSTRSRW